jgi:hypothetical protein
VTTRPPQMPWRHSRRNWATERNSELVNTEAIIAELEDQRDRLSAAIQALSRKRVGETTRRTSQDHEPSGKGQDRRCHEETVGRTEEEGEGGLVHWQPTPVLKSFYGQPLLRWYGVECSSPFSGIGAPSTSYPLQPLCIAAGIPLISLDWMITRS